MEKISSISSSSTSSSLKSSLQDNNKNDSSNSNNSSENSNNPIIVPETIFQLSSIQESHSNQIESNKSNSVKEFQDDINLKTDLESDQRFK